MESIDNERTWRLETWNRIKSEGFENLPPQFLRDLGVYGGASGIWVDKSRTSELLTDPNGITVGILHTGRHYPDDLSEDGLIYHYPVTNRPPSRDAGEVQATRNAKDAGLPIFVILPGITNRTGRCVRIGWVEDWDDQAKLFLIIFGEQEPSLLEAPGLDTAFNLEGDYSSKTTSSKSRPNQQRFRFRLLKEYGPKCAVCSINLPQLLIAAHVRGKGEQGSDDWRNGVLLCGTHHDAFDQYLFGIDPEDLSIITAPNLSARDLRIKERRLTPLSNQPHKEALKWKWVETQKKWSAS